MIKFFMEMVENKKLEIKNLSSFELSRDLDAACDGLRLSFLSDSYVGEIAKVYAYDDSKIVFNGYVDTQRQQFDSNGYKVFLYVRSSACLLVDNEAEPITYNCPSAYTLCYKNAGKFGFKWDIPNITISDYYEVQKGTSSFGVIDNFVKANIGKGIFVDPENTIKILDSNRTIEIEKDKLISEKKIINRGSGITTIDYKLDGKATYNYHLKSQTLKSKGINRQQKINLGSLPNWQKQMIVKNRLKNSAIDYYCAEFIISDFVTFNLCDKIRFDSYELGKFENYYVTKINYKKDSKGITTRIVVNEQFDLGEINYVAE